jgi:hypothetical protein
MAMVILASNKAAPAVQARRAGNTGYRETYALPRCREARSFCALQSRA